MPDLLTNSGAATLFHGVSAEARAALVTTLAKQQAKRTCVLLVTDPRRAQELATEAETYAQWLSTEGHAGGAHFPEVPPPDIDATRRADRICERLIRAQRLAARRATSARLIVATPEAILGACPERTQFESRQLKLRTGEATCLQTTGRHTHRRARLRRRSALRAPRPDSPPAAA